MKPEPQERPGFCPTYRPTKAEFSIPFADYVSQICVDNPGLPMFKVIPPRGWSPRDGTSPLPRLETLSIKSPIQQNAFGQGGVYQCVLVEQPPCTAAHFKGLAESARYAAAPRGERGPPKDVEGRTPQPDTGRAPVSRRPAGKSAEAARAEEEEEAAASVDSAAAALKDEDLMERPFWRSVTLNPPLYGADTPMSLFDENLKYGWNLRSLGGDLLRQAGVPNVPGVTSPMTYFGMWKSFFSWHVEDQDLLSINFMHFGAPKVWYCVSPEHRQRFEDMCASLYPDAARACRAFTRHKDILISPAVLRAHNIPYVKAKQMPNEFVVLNAAAYHAGFNLGFNCAEAINFATPDWVPLGAAAKRCNCSALRDGVRIDMNLFGVRNVDSDPEDDSDAASAESGSDVEADSDEEADSSEEEEEESSEEEEEEVEDKPKRSRSGTRSKRPPAKAARRSTSSTPRARSRSAAAAKPRSRPASAAKPRPRSASAARPRARAASASATSRSATTAAGTSRSRSKPAATPVVHGVRSGTRMRTPSARAVASLLQPSPPRSRPVVAWQPAPRNYGGATREPPAYLRPVLKSEDGPRKTATAMAAAQKLRTASNKLAMARRAAEAKAAARRAKCSRRSGSEDDGAAEEQVPLSEGPSEDVKPMAVVGENEANGERYFYLVQPMTAYEAGGPERARLRWLRKGEDGLFRPTTKVWTETASALIKVRTQYMRAAPEPQGPAPGWKLLTLQRRILETDLID